MTSPLRKKQPTTAPNTLPAKATKATGALRGAWLVGWACVGFAACTLLASGETRVARSDEGPAPLFLAPRALDEESTPALRRAARKRLEEREAAVANANLKWKPYRPATAESAVAETSTDAPRSAAAPPRATASTVRSRQSNQTEVLLVDHVERTGTGNISREDAAADNGSAQSDTADCESGACESVRTASQISAVDDPGYRRVIPRATRSNFRSQVLHVSTDEIVTVQFGEPFDDTRRRRARAGEPTPAEPTPAEPPQDSYYPTEPGQMESPTPGADPLPIAPSRDPFPEEPLPPPTREPVREPAGGTPFGLAEPPASVDCQRDKVECEKALRTLRNTTLDKLSIDCTVTGEEGKDFPCECPLTGEFGGRNWGCTTFTWKASLAVHKPLYFEEVELERYGHAMNPLIGPVFSGAHFFLTIPFLPYKMSLAPPNECQYVLGYYRPGSCAPYLVPPVPLSVEAMMVEAGSIVSGVFILR